MTKVVDPVDEYFFKQDQDLIKEMRQKLDEERKQQEKAKAKEAHWMKCPKCGSDLQEVEWHEIKAEQCVDCKGTFFDAGEMEMLNRYHKPASWIEWLLKESFR